MVSEGRHRCSQAFLGDGDGQTRDRSRSRGASRRDGSASAVCLDRSEENGENSCTVDNSFVLEQQVDDDAVESAASDVNSGSHSSETDGQATADRHADHLEALFQRFEEFFGESAVPSAASQDALRDISTVSFDDTMAACMKQDAQCVVCLVEFQAGDDLEKLPHCEHLFHSGCIRRWLERTSSCPICRRTLFARGQGLGPGAVTSIVGLHGSSHLNGCSATCIHWDEQLGRWLVRLSSNEEKSIQPSNLRCIKNLSVGTCIRTAGLANAEHLNDIRGCCLQWKPEAGRWHVRLENGEEKAFRPNNLEVEHNGASPSDVLSQIEHLMENPPAMHQLDSFVREMLNNPHGAQHVHQFLQEFMGNPELQRFLNTLPDGPSMMAALGEMVSDPGEMQRRLAATPALSESLFVNPSMDSAVRDFIGGPQMQRVMQEMLSGGRPLSE